MYIAHIEINDAIGSPAKLASMLKDLAARIEEQPKELCQTTIRGKNDEHFGSVAHIDEYTEIHVHVPNVSVCIGKLTLHHVEDN